MLSINGDTTLQSMYPTPFMLQVRCLFWMAPKSIVFPKSRMQSSFFNRVANCCTILVAFFSSLIHVIITLDESSWKVSTNSGKVRHMFNLSLFNDRPCMILRTRDE